jgi:hypothetical protein
LSGKSLKEEQLREEYLDHALDYLSQQATSLTTLPQGSFSNAPTQLIPPWLADSIVKGQGGSVVKGVASVNAFGQRQQGKLIAAVLNNDNELFKEVGQESTAYVLSTLSNMKMVRIPEAGAMLNFMPRQSSWAIISMPKDVVHAQNVILEMSGQSSPALDQDDVEFPSDRLWRFALMTDPRSAAQGRELAPLADDVSIEVATSFIPLLTLAQPSILRTELPVGS